MRKIFTYLTLFFLSTSLFAQNYTILGNSSALSGCNTFRITPDADDQHGAIFQNQTINLNNSFDFTFSVFLGCNGGSGADGMCFVLTNNPNGLGNAGEGLGYAGSNQPFSFAVEFDTWQNGSVGDPGYDHIAFESGGGYAHNAGGPVPALASQANIDDCNWHTVRIVWDVASGTYSVYFDGVLRLQVVNPNLVNTYFGGNPIVNWGWSGATGGGSNDQQVQVLSTSSWVAGTNYQSCNTTMQFSDISTSNLGSIQSWAWTFGDGGTSTLQNPTHTYAANGTYTVTLTITDLSGCATTYSHTVTINAPITLAPTITQPLCNGAANGGISIVPAGGFGPAAGYGGYMYTWSNGTNQTTLVGATAGTYTLTVTDGVCTTTGSYTINQPTAITASVTHTDANCGLNNGTASITISGGTGPYYGTPIPTGVNWGPGHAGSSVSGLSAGTFIADFQDANGCSALLQYAVTVASLPCGINISTSSVAVKCFGGSNGSATVTVVGGSPPINIAWSNGGNTPTISGLVAGTYTYTVTDVSGNPPIVGNVVVTQPLVAMVASIATVDMTCSGSNDGSALASVVSGGTSPYSYAWSPVHPNNPVASGLSAGPISVVVTDFNNCTANASGTITGPPTLTLNITTVNDSCFQSSTGSAMANVTGGNPPYTFYWSNISSAQNNLSLGIGTYTVTVTDNAGCTITGSANISQPAPFTHTLSSTNINCFGNSTGSITLTVAGGIPAITYTWNPATAVGIAPTNLAAGQYNVTIQDANRCQILDSVILTQPAAALTAVTSHTDVTCNGAADGTVTLTIAGGTAPYSYAGNPIPPGTTTLPNQGPITYSGNITDSKGCTVAVSETVSQPPVLTVSETHVNVLCNSAATGSIDITAVGGNAGGYTYSWNDGVASEDRTNLIAGNYCVTVTDTKACTAAICITISQPTPVTVTETHTDVLCNGGTTGTINLTPGGGTPGYSYSWSDINNNQNRTGLSAATYTVTVYDSPQCSVTLSITVGQPTTLNVTTSHTNVTCNGANNGTVTVTIAGGTAPYSYLGNPIPGGTTVIPALAPATYAGNVLDANGCSVAVSETITQPGPQSATVTGTNATCFGGTQGTANSTFVNATGLVTYLWTNGATTQNITTLNAGNYCVTATDANTCTVTGCYVVTQPAAVSLTLATVDATCFGGNGSATATPNGGTGPFSYAWNSSPSIINTATLLAGNFTVTSTDANTCQQTATGVINQPTDINIQVAQTDVNCFGDATGLITLTVTGGTGPNYTYAWTPNVSNSNIASSLTAGPYNVTVTDQANCTKNTTIIINQPAQALSINIQTSNVTCFGQNNGKITVLTSGGTPVYSYNWNPNVSAVDSATNLAPLQYDITVTDSKACTVASSVVISQPNQPLMLVDSSKNLNCFQSNDGMAMVTANGGTWPYGYVWTPNVSISNIATSLAAANYSVVVTDNNGCTNSSSFVITQPALLSASEVHTNILCNGNSTGTATVTAQGGTLGYAYTWNPNVSSTNTATNISASTYTVLVTDTNFCTTTVSINVTQPAVLSISLTETDVLCGGGNTGTVLAVGLGGTPAYNYTLSDGTNLLNSSTGQFANLVTGTYTAGIIDANGCVDSSQIFVNEPVPLADIVNSTPASCKNYADGQIEILASGGTPSYNYVYSNGVSNATGILNGLSAGVYSFTITDANNCSIMDSAEVTEPDSVVITVLPNPTEVKLGDVLQLNTTTNQSGTLNYSWSPSFGLSCYDCYNPVFDGVYTYTYNVVVTNAAGCTGTSNVVVKVIPNYDVFIPNAFTPNGDGTNDFWQLFGNMKSFKQVEVMVFNRIGEKVFESNDINFKWDGTYKGEFAQPGVYSYVAKFVWLNNHSDSNYKGTLTLLR